MSNVIPFSAQKTPPNSDKLGIKASHKNDINTSTIEAFEFKLAYATNTVGPHNSLTSVTK